ncbi:MAG: transporter substrate-binding domain-containing protein [Marinobacter sp.]|nr:transporter substrate-binding domain-containing protein [Marinobacter sp.]
MTRQLCFFCVALYTLVAPVSYANAVESLRLFTEHYPPFNMQDEDTVRGTNTELLNKAFAELGIEVTHRVVPWARAQANAQLLDNACFYSAVRSAEREPLYQWAGPLSREYITLFARKDRAINLDSVAEAASWRVGGQLGDAYVQWLLDRGIEVDTLGGSTSSIEKLIFGRLDLWVAGSIGGPMMAMERNVELHAAFQSDEGSELWLACNPALPSDLIHRLNEIIARYHSDGTSQRILERYIKTP